ncbi:MAG: ABC transporter ATP-binding protein [Acidiferrobacterales bacterium]
MSTPAIEVRDLGFSYNGKQQALKDIDLEVKAGEIYGLVGADGAGKTTLLRIAAGQLVATGGTIHVLGKDPTTPDVRGQLAYMPQGFGLYPDLSCIENLHFFADLHGLNRTDANRLISDLMKRTGLAGFEDRRAGKLSGGMMQKLALACALVSRPRLMLLDEPTTGVDPLSRRAFWSLLDRVRAEGVAILYATANMDEAERCDRVGMLENGRIAHQGTPVELSESGNNVLLAVSGTSIRQFRHQLQALPGVQFVFPIGKRLMIWLHDDDGVKRFREALEKIDPSLESEAVVPSLHDIALRELAIGEGARP